MYYPWYNNPFYYPQRAYMPNMCSYATYTENNTSTFRDESTPNENNQNFDEQIPIKNNDFFTINEDRLEVFGISINIDDLIILIMLFFMFRESQIDYSVIIILALILFDQR